MRKIIIAFVLLVIAVVIWFITLSPEEKKRYEQIGRGETTIETEEAIIQESPQTTEINDTKVDNN